MFDFSNELRCDEVNALIGLFAYRHQHAAIGQRALRLGQLARRQMDALQSVGDGLALGLARADFAPWHDALGLRRDYRHRTGRRSRRQDAQLQTQLIGMIITLA